MQSKPIFAVFVLFNYGKFLIDRVSSEFHDRSGNGYMMDRVKNCINQGVALPIECIKETDYYIT